MDTGLVDAIDGVVAIHVGCAFTWLIIDNITKTQSAKTLLFRILENILIPSLKVIIPGQWLGRYKI
jgi:hypothetical protein